MKTRKSSNVCLVDTNIFLCLAFEDPGYAHCGDLLDKAFREEYTLLLSSIQITELYTPFLRSEDKQGLESMRKEIEKLQPIISDVDQTVAERAAQHRSTVQTPEGRWLSLADSIILATATVEEAGTLYTIDTDFARVKQIRVEAPGMNLRDWIEKYGTEKQREIIRFL